MPKDSAYQSKIGDRLNKMIEGFEKRDVDSIPLPCIRIGKFNQRVISYGIMFLQDFIIYNTKYQDTEVNIRYIRLPKSIQGFNFITMSLNAYKWCCRDSTALGKLEVVFDQEYGWKAQLPDLNPKDSFPFIW